MGHVIGEPRGQGALFPVALDELIPAEHPARVIDAFAGSLNMVALGFGKAQPAATGRPPYDPADLLRLYLYGYLNQIRSSRRLERECHRNVEVMWLLNRLAPDHKTIADFRRLNSAAFKAVCRGFVRFCAEAGLVAGQWVAIDGSKFQAVASKRAVIDPVQLQEELSRIDQQVQRYLDELEVADAQESGLAEPQVEALREALSRLQERRADVVTTQAILEDMKASHHVVGEGQAKVMKTAQGPSIVAYNVQSAVDAEHKIVVHHEVISEPFDSRSLLPVATATKEVLGGTELNVVADTGYSNGEHLKRCEQAGITVYLPVQRAVNTQGREYFDRSKFTYDPASDCYRCPAGEVLRRKTIKTDDRQVVYSTKRCGDCTLKPQCTKSRQRSVTRHFDEDVLERTRQRLESYPQAMILRQATVEHPFANLKHHILGNARLLLRGLSGARAELALAVLAYNFSRAMKLLGNAAMQQKLVPSG